MSSPHTDALQPIRRALISVSNKEGLVPFARQLAQRDVQIFSTGGTARKLQDAQIPVQDVATYTGFPEMMDGRLKTLHPRVFGGILARRDRPDDLEALRAHQIHLFDLVVVNLYPFEQTVARPDVNDREAVEQIDIGGPSLLRAAAKNHQFVTVVTDSSQYNIVLTQIQEHGGTTLTARRELATAAFRRTATYDLAIADFFLFRYLRQQWTWASIAKPKKTGLPLVARAH